MQEGSVWDCRTLLAPREGNLPFPLPLMALALMQGRPDALRLGVLQTPPRRIPSSASFHVGALAGQSDSEMC